MVNAHDLDRHSSNLETFVVPNPLLSPWLVMRFTVCTSWTRRRINIFQLSRKKASSSHQFENGKTEVSKTFMKNGKLMMITMDQGDVRILFYIAFAAGRQGKTQFNRRHRLRCKVIVVESNGCWLTQIFIDLSITIPMLLIYFRLPRLFHHEIPRIRVGCRHMKRSIIWNQG